MKVLLITSGELHPKESYTSCFEVFLAEGLRKKGVHCGLMSVYMITPFNLFKAMVIKTLFGFKKNAIAERFSLRQLYRFFFAWLILQRRDFCLQHKLWGFDVYEAIGISPVTIDNLEQFYPVWTRSGMNCYKSRAIEFNADLLHSHSRFFLATSLACRISEAFKTPYVITEHSSYYFRNLIPSVMIPVMQKIYRRASTFVAVSKVLKDRVADVLNIELRGSVIGNPLASIYMENRFFRDKVSEQAFTILAIGSLDHNKNHELLIRSFAKAAIPGAQLIIAGQGDLKDQLIDLAASLTLTESVKLKGYLPNEEIGGLLKTASVLVVSSKVETFSVVVTEAHACGVPVISTPCGGPAELVTKDNGILLSSFSEDEMATAMRSIYEQKVVFDPSVIRKQALDKYSPEIIAEEYKALYESILNANNIVS